MRLLAGARYMREDRNSLKDALKNGHRISNKYLDNILQDCERGRKSLGDRYCFNISMNAVMKVRTYHGADCDSVQVQILVRV